MTTEPDILSEPSQSSKANIAYSIIAIVIVTVVAAYFWFPAVGLGIVLLISVVLSPKRTLSSWFMYSQGIGFVLWLLVPLGLSITFDVMNNYTIDIEFYLFFMIGLIFSYGAMKRFWQAL